MAEAFEYGALHGSFEIVETSLFRTRGRIREVRREMLALNERLAIELQRNVAQALRQSLMRPYVTQGTLERVLLDKRNRLVTQDGFGVGRPEFLDVSAAKYWEQIDQGTEVHLGQIMQGLWGDEMTRTGSRTRIGGMPTAFGRGSGQGFQPMSKRRAERILREANGLSRKKASARQLKRMGHDARAKLRREEDVGDVTGMIQNPIEGEHYFRRGWENFGHGRRIRNEYAALFQRLGIPAHWSNGGTLASGRGALGG